VFSILWCQHAHQIWPTLLGSALRRLTGNKTFFILYFVDRASRYKFMLKTNLAHFFMYLFISSLYMFRASQCSSSGDRTVLVHHLV